MSLSCDQSIKEEEYVSSHHSGMSKFLPFCSALLLKVSSRYFLPARELEVLKVSWQNAFHIQGTDRMYALLYNFWPKSRWFEIEDSN